MQNLPASAALTRRQRPAPAVSHVQGDRSVCLHTSPIAEREDVVMAWHWVDPDLVFSPEPYEDDYRHMPVHDWAVEGIAPLSEPI